MSACDWLRRGLMLWAAMGLSVVAAAQEVGSREWFEHIQAQAKASSAAMERNTFVTMWREVGPTGDERRLQELRAEVAGKPEHPLRQELVNLERTLTNGPDVTRSRVWFYEDSKWRVSNDEEWRAGAPWSDTALRDGDAWRLIPSTLTVGAAGDRTLPPESSPLQAIKTYVTLLRGSGLHLIADRSLDGVTRTGDRVTARLRDSAGSAVSEIRGRVVDESEFVVESIVLVEHPDASAVGSAYRFVEDVDVGVPRLFAGVRASSAIEMSGAKGRTPTTKVRIEEYRKVLDEESASMVLKTPRLEEGDFVRDLGSVTGIVDRKGGTMAAVEGGSVVVTQSVPTVSQSSEKSWIKLVQGGLAGVVLVGVILLVWNKFKR